MVVFYPPMIAGSHVQFRGENIPRPIFSRYEIGVNIAFAPLEFYPLILLACINKSLNNSSISRTFLSRIWAAETDNYLQLPCYKRQEMVLIDLTRSEQNNYD
jgi:hypothetical protein